MIIKAKNEFNTRIYNEYADYYKFLTTQSQEDIIKKHITRTYVYQSIIDFFEDTTLKENQYILLNKIEKDEILRTIYDRYLYNEYTSVNTYSDIQELINLICYEIEDNYE